MTDPALLHKLEALFGQAWAEPLAKATMRGRSTAYDWKAGKHPIPKAVREWVEREYERRAGS